MTVPARPAEAPREPDDPSDAGAEPGMPPLPSLAPGLARRLSEIVHGSRDTERGLRQRRLPPRPKIPPPPRSARPPLLRPGQEEREPG